ncbi:hypothetical protein LX64_01427 [Chitinophaga skermanii]|uniref:Uncharacterized protein n=1 Tax=Chitinophaga skermanii TaxID=331697 RepID=A0A327QZB0_9BACT|nr:hypothetical protein LX64_01427 [Chitinophaga skermanii]
MFLDFQRTKGSRVMNPNTLMKEGEYKQLWFHNTIERNKIMLSLIDAKGITSQFLIE